VIKRASTWVEAFAIGLGAPGLLLLSFVDSSVLALPQVVEILIVWMVLAQPDRWLLYGGLATVGSVAGLFLLYALARKGGEAFIRKRLHARHVERAMAAFQRYGVVTLILPSLIPPPVPLKPFVLMAGVAAMPQRRFLFAVSSGRFVRFVGLALLTSWYGQPALDYVRANALFVTLVALGVMAAGVMGYYAYRKLGPTR
jgi:membrane protein YqaA with SNARE-associated domain